VGGVRPGFLAWLAVSALACDLGSPAIEPGAGPALHVIEAHPADGDGVECAPGDPDCGVELNTQLRLRLDRVIRPESATRQAIRLYTGEPRNGGPFLSPEYDLLRGEVSYRTSFYLQPRALYRVELVEPEGARDDGLRAFDGAAIQPGPEPLDYSFLTRASLPAGSAAEAVADPTCDEIVALLSASCSSGSCHGGEHPAEGLSLADARGLRETAIGRVARQTELELSPGVAFSEPERFGAAMPIIDPRSPATSYLLYKLLIDPENLDACGAGCGRFLPLEEDRPCLAPDPAEIDRLRAWFVRGEPMPRAPGRDAELPGAFHPLGCAAMRALSRFIENGAACPD
jgi:hypothetical protein